LGGFQRIVAERTFSLQNLKSLRVSSTEDTEEIFKKF
jgi:hypothetical protein